MVLNSHIGLKLSYGGHAWCQTHSEIPKLSALYNRFLRSMIRNSFDQMKILRKIPLSNPVAVIALACVDGGFPFLTFYSQRGCFLGNYNLCLFKSRVNKYLSCTSSSYELLNPSSLPPLQQSCSVTLYIDSLVLHCIN